MERIDFIKLSLLSVGGLYMHPNLAMAQSVRRNRKLFDKEYSIKSSSLTMSRLLLNYMGKTSKELSVDIKSNNTAKGIDAAFIKKINELDIKIKRNYDAYSIKPNPKTSDIEFENTLKKITSLSRAGSVGLMVGGSFLIHPLLGTFLASSIGGGIIYDAVKDWIIVDDQNVIGDKLNANIEDINQLKTSIQNLHLGINNAYTTINNNSQATEYSLNSLQNQISGQGRRVDNLLVNEQKSIEDLINYRFSNNSKQFKQLQNKIASIDGKIEIANTQLNTINSKIDLTNVNIIQSSQKVIEVVGGKVDTIGKYIWLNLPSELQMQALNDKDLAFVQDLEKNGKLAATKKKLQKAIDTKEFEVWYSNLKSKFDAANTIIGETYKAARALGLKGKDAERAGEIVTLAQQASSVALSFASSNPVGYVTGVMQSINLLGSLFGGRPKEDPVLKALKQISEQLNNMHNDMIKGFEHLDKKLDGLAELNIKIYKNLMTAVEQQTKFQHEWFKHISFKLDVLNENQQLILKKINDITVFIINEREKDITILEGFEKSRIQDYGILFDSFDDYATAYKNGGISSGLISLNAIVTNISTNNDLSYFSIITDKFRQNLSQEAYFEAIELFQPCRSLFETFYGNKEFNKIGLNALLFPTNKLIDNSKIYDFTKNLDVSNENHNITKLDATYLSPAIISKISHLYVVYCHYYEIQKNSNTIEPGSIEDYLKLDALSRRIRIKEITKRLDSLITVTNQSIAQQSLMSGHLLLTQIENILFNGLKPSLKSAVKKVLKGNYILANNFVRHLLYVKLDPSISQVNLDNYKSAYKSKSTYTLSRLIGFSVSTGSKRNLKIELLPDLKLYLPSSEEIVSNDMLYPSNIELLMLTKKQLIQKKMDLEFGSVFNS